MDIGLSGQPSRGISDGISLVRKSPRVRKFSGVRGGANKLDGRSAEAKYLKRIRALLTEHVGGHPSAVQVELIDRCAWLAVHLGKIDARTVEQGVMGDLARREYLAWSNAYRRTLCQLGGEPERTPAGRSGPTTLEAFLDRRAAAKAPTEVTP